MSLIPYAHLLGLPARTPKRRSSKGVAKPADFTHLSKPTTAVPVTPKAQRRMAGVAGAGADEDFDATDAQTPTIPCAMCEGSGAFGGDDCPACDGEGALTAKQADERSKDFADQFKDVQDKVQGRKPVGRDPTPKPGSVAAKVLMAGREADRSDRGGGPKPGSFAARVLAAGRKARGE